MSNNKLLTANEVIKALVQGNDPTTNQPLPPDSILNRADVLRALLTASTTIDDALARAARRAQLPGNVGRAWEKAEEETMVAAFKAKETIASIAARHGRTPRAIEARLERLGIITPDQRTTSNTFFTPGKEDSSDE